MAAGKVHVSRRGEFYHLPNQVSDASEYGRYYVGLRGDRGFSGGNDTWVRNYEKKRDGRGYEYGHVYRKTKRGLLLDGRLSGNGLNRGLQIRAAEAVDVDSGDMLPSEKRRKFSPVILHMEEHNFALSSKNNAMVAEISISSPSSVNKLALSCAVDESPVHFSLTQETCMNDEREPGQLDEEDFSHAPNISTSRWAYDDDLLDNNHRDGDRDVLGVEEKRKKTESPESGVIQREDSDVCRARSSLYEGDECLGSESDNNEAMEVDEKDVNEGLDASESDLESEHVAEARVAECGSSDMLQECRCVSDYEKLGKINEGSYGVVYRARDKKTGELVALKKLKMGVEREGFPLYYLREINILLSFNHPSIVNVKEVVVDDGNAGFYNVFMVMEYMEHDLKGLIQSRNQPFSQSEVKCLMLQLLEGVKYLHDHWVLHRDLKTSNILLNNKGELKICDFGMSRHYGSPLKPYTPWVVTLWYRAPELLLGAKEYSTAVDMWSVGCIMAELLSNKPLFDGKTEFDQLDKIFKILGTPTERIWPGYSQLPGVKINIVQHPYNVLHKKFPRTSFTGSPVLSDLGLDLLSQLLTYDPDKRITAEDALNHGWFRDVPLPKCKDFMPTFPALHSQKR